jgi:deoxyribonuclease V
MDRGEKVGELVRSRQAVRPLYVSPGHRMTFGLATELVLRCGAGLRLPEPTRLAHQATSALLRASEGPGG